MRACARVFLAAAVTAIVRHYYIIINHSPPSCAQIAWALYYPKVNVSAVAPGETVLYPGLTLCLVSCVFAMIAHGALVWMYGVALWLTCLMVRVCCVPRVHSACSVMSAQLL